jgi:hypothetical protein
MNALASFETAPNWQPIAAIPETRHDGRDVLLWVGRAILASWCDGWCDAVGRPVKGVTHFADVEGPAS